MARSPRSGRSSPGFLLERFEWSSVFLVTLPLAAVALIMALRFVPAHINETDEPVDNLGGVLSAVLVGSAILAINFLPVPGERVLALGLIVIAVVAGVAFILRQQRAQPARCTTSRSPDGGSSGSRPAPGSSSSAR